MLRSLVGSEMCIRDRVHPGDARMRGEEFRHRLGVGDVALHAHVQRLQACLLYTSDAADDLLCVDLGGRRIIKKKNP